MRGRYPFSTKARQHPSFRPFERLSRGVLHWGSVAWMLLSTSGCAKTPECIEGVERRCEACPSETQICFGNPALWSACNCPETHLGEPCESGEQCGGAEICDNPNSSAFLNGSAPGGMCVIDCGRDAASCPTGFHCVDTLGPSGGVHRCLEECTLGYGCTETPELVCSADVDTLSCGGGPCPLASGQGMCRPLCATDADCSERATSSSANAYCHRGSGVCVAEPVSGAALGTSCGAASPDVQCQGQCISDQTAAYSFCTHSCRFQGEGSSAGWCEFDAGDPAVPTGYCGLRSSPAAGIGDAGYCVPLCLEVGDCPTGMECDTGYPTATPMGLCVPRATAPTPDGGAQTEDPASAPVPPGNASDAGGSEAMSPGREETTDSRVLDASAL